MPKQSLAGVPSVVTSALEDLTASLDPVDRDTVVTAATWAFCSQDATFRNWVVQDYWYQGLGIGGASEVGCEPVKTRGVIYALAARFCSPFRRRFAQ
jgi:hypothetical protein